MSHEIFVLGILLIAVLGPIWIAFHYITRWKSMKGLSSEDEQMLAEMWENTNRMEQRIGSLEKILDAEVPGWRERA